ncbi:hypothetical protein NUW58_g3035 [Xylaria curta]|uniref:Uncharacterized protein n=1 Tax=Xylaria curta TaxID=42375 RepID=A0ACC1PEJ3_9PEZI|nr:hypothetical protein NUW58_g3035 [Xylaria curta]
MTRREKPASQKHRQKGPGRPPNARRIWQQPHMKRRLIRLYLYTAESTLTTKQISQLISALAQHEDEELAITNESVSPPSTNTRPQTETRSTQYELRKLLGEGYRGLRPRDRHDARKRAEEFRHIRHGRVTKDYRKNRNTHHEKYRSRPSSCQSLYSHPESWQTIDPQSGIREIIDTYPPVSGARTELTEFDISGAKSRIRDSWLREKLTSISKQRPSSSVCIEIRGLLSRFSACSSVLSTRLSSLAGDSDPLPTGRDMGGLSTNAKARLIKLCCLHRKDCIHRKFLQTASREVLPTNLQNGGLTLQDFTMEHGRDIWNYTPLHLAAEWASADIALSLVHTFLYLCESDILNLRNIWGETFVHVLVRRWSSLGGDCVFGGIGEFFTRITDQGFDLNICDRQNTTAVACLIRCMAQDWKPDAVRSGLSSLLSLRYDPFWHVAARSISDNDLQFIYKESQSNWDNWQHKYEEICEIRLKSGLLIHEKCLVPCYKSGEGINSTRSSTNIEHDKNGRTCLMALIYQMECPASKSELESIDSILLENPDLRLLDHDGNTALHYAVRAGLSQIVQKLIQAGIDAHAHDTQGNTTVDLALLQYAESSRPRNAPFSAWYANSQAVLVRVLDSIRTIKLNGLEETQES